jgi:hypothetical protein
MQAADPLTLLPIVWLPLSLKCCNRVLHPMHYKFCPNFLPPPPPPNTHRETCKDQKFTELLLLLKPLQRLAQCN